MNLYDNERKFCYEGVCVKYLLITPEIKSDKLIIGFSAFSLKEPTYNYVNTLKDIPVNRLYILDDYGEKGSYYLGNINSTFVQDAVVNLIEHVMTENNIKRQDVTCIGSSKGGVGGYLFCTKM